MDNIDKTSIETERQKGSRIYTKLKFIRSDVSGSPVSFVSKHLDTGRIYGVRQDSKYPKKVCIVDKAIADQIMLNALYNCTLVPMTEKNGYVVISAEPVQFRAKINSTYIKGNVYVVEVKFGNKTIRFDPFCGRKESVKNLKECKRVLERRIDIKNVMQVAEDFERAAIAMVRIMENDKYSKFKL